MSDLFANDPRVAPTPPRKRPRALLITTVTVAVAFMLLSLFSTVWTERLWFGSLGYGEVFSTMLWTRVGLFLVFGAVMALVVGGNILLAYRVRPLFRPAAPDQAGLDRYREVVVPVRTWLLAGASLMVGGLAGVSGAGQWRSFLMWRNAEDFGEQDAYFGRDVGFYIFHLPWLHYVVNYLMVVLAVALIASACVHYLFGGVRLQVSHDRLSPAAIAHFSVLLGLWVLAKAADYYLDRFDLVNQNGPLITGMTYTDQNALWPARNILAGIAVICALLFFLNVWRRTWALSAMGLAMMLVSSVLLGMVWPAVIQQVSVKPSEADKEAPYIAANIEATKKAYDLEAVETVPFDGQAVPTPDQETTLDSLTASLPLVDPRLVRRSFEQDQQVRAFYTVPNVLDVDRYEIEGKDRALVVGVRELDQEGLDPGNRNWSNLHTVYTHGNGVIAAYANQRPANNERESTQDVVWAEGQDANQRALTDLATDGYETRVYYGERSPEYSIVGKASSGADDVELDLAGSTLSETEAGNTTYDGSGGVEVGGLWNKLLYAVKFGEPNILLSGRVNENSKILYDRNPGDMVRKVAPWLTVDSDPFPAVVDGRIVWILDGYTMTNQYPQAQSESFASMTDDSLATDTGFQTLPTDEINYMRNAVKATVDAYDGTVTLYAWDEEDPILKAWRSAFPGVVKDAAEIPEALMSHLRYPEDLYKVQRYQYARYHVEDAKAWYEDNNRWEVPRDPESEARQQPPYRLFVNAAADVKDTSGETYGLTSVYVPRGKDNLAAFMWANSDATSPDYGKLQVLELPSGDATSGPRQIANEMENDPKVRDELRDFTSGNIEPQNGNMLAIPVGDGMMYVQPVYASRDAGAASPPLLQFVLVAYGNEVGIGTTLDRAIVDALSAGETTDGGTDPGTDPGTGTEPPSTDTGNLTGSLPQEARRLLRQADAAYQEADRLQRQGDTAGWAAKLDEARGLVEDALSLLNNRNNN